MLSDTVWSRRLSFFGHLNRADPCQDYYRALQACIADTPVDWRRRPGRPRQSWLSTVETDLRPLNLGLATAKRRAQDRAAWRRLVATATSTLTSSWKQKKKKAVGMDRRKGREREGRGRGGVGGRRREGWTSLKVSAPSAFENMILKTYRRT